MPSPRTHLIVSIHRNALNYKRELFLSDQRTIARPLKTIFHLLQLEWVKAIFSAERRLAVTTQILQFVELSDEDRKETGRLGKIGRGDRVEVRVKRRTGPDQTLSLPPDAAALIETLLGHLLEGARVAVLTEDQELSPNDAASILGVSRPLVVHRMEVGELPFRYVGKHRRAKLKDVLGLKSKIDAQRATMEALADDAEDVKQRYGA
jgi:hypothetical protein